MSKTQNNEIINQFIERCRSAGLSVTPQRIAIYKALRISNSHPSPEDIYKIIHPEYPTIALATVYKTLETFEKHNIISLVPNFHNTIRYDTHTERHHHIVCSQCHKIMDITDSGLDNLPVPQSVTRNNKFVDFSVHFNVVCELCLTENSNFK